MCRCGGNACDPNAPEYGKKWKGENNAGCLCKGITQSCDCSSATATPPRKIGCYTTVMTNGIPTYKTGNSVFRKVC